MDHRGGWRIKNHGRRDSPRTAYSRPMTPASPLTAPRSIHRLAILDDFQHVAESLADWDALRARGVELTFFHEHLGHGPERVAAALAETPDSPGFDAILAMRERTVFDAATVALLPQLRLLVTTGKGNKSIDLGAAAAQGITVCGTAGSAAGAPELTWALMLAALRGIPAAESELRTGGWQGAGTEHGTDSGTRQGAGNEHGTGNESGLEPGPTPLGREAAGLTLGLVGLGRIGAIVARYARAFEMDVVAWSPHLTHERATAAGARLAPSLEALAHQSDVLSVHLQPAPSTQGIITEPVLRALGPDGLFVNTARSALVDMEALGRGLRQGWLGGAALDVFDVEPLPAHDEVLTWPRTVLTPHLGYVTRQAYQVFFPQAVEDVLAYLDGAPLRLLG